MSCQTCVDTVYENQLLREQISRLLDERDREQHDDPLYKALCKESHRYRQELNATRSRLQMLQKRQLEQEEQYNALRDKHEALLGLLRRSL